MRASLRGALGQGDHAGLARHDGKGSTAATASGGANRWRSRAERKKEDDGGGGAAIYSREGRVRRRQLTHELAMEPTACHNTRKRQKTIGGGSCVAPAASREVALGLVLIFEVFTELPLHLFCKLLTNFLKKLKISKNESCSTFQTLQLCFKEYFQILPPF